MNEIHSLLTNQALKISINNVGGQIEAAIGQYDCQKMQHIGNKTLFTYKEKYSIVMTLPEHYKFDIATTSFNSFLPMVFSKHFKETKSTYIAKAITKEIDLENMEFELSELTSSPLPSFRSTMDPILYPLDIALEMFRLECLIQQSNININTHNKK